MDDGVDHGMDDGVDHGMDARGPGDLRDDDPGTILGLGLRWEAAPPEGVTAPCDDPAWAAAVALLADDAEFLIRRALVESIALHVVIDDADEATLTAYPADGPTTSVVLVLPVLEHRDPDGDWLCEDERVAVHVDAVATLIVETAAALDIDPAE